MAYATPADVRSALATDGGEYPSEDDSTAASMSDVALQGDIVEAQAVVDSYLRGDPYGSR